MKLGALSTYLLGTHYVMQVSVMKSYGHPIMWSTWPSMFQCERKNCSM